MKQQKKEVNIGKIQAVVYYCFEIKNGTGLKWQHHSYGKNIFALTFSFNVLFYLGRVIHTKRLIFEENNLIIQNIKMF